MRGSWTGGPDQVLSSFIPFPAFRRVRSNDRTVAAAYERGSVLMSIEVTDELVDRIARLSRLALSPEEIREIKAHFEKVLQFVRELEELDLDSVDPSLFSLDASNIHREDEIRPSFRDGEALANAPGKKLPYFLVPRIVEDAPGAGEVTP